MSIGILYESEEWSTYVLEKYIQELGIPAFLINMEKEVDEETLLSCDLMVNRVFASAQFRGHHNALSQMPRVIDLLKRHGIPMVNPYDAHFYEIDKDLTTRTLLDHGFSAPKVFGTFYPKDAANSEFPYPCIVKPNCGGRTNYTFIVHNKDELLSSMEQTPEIEMLAEEYIKPTFGFLTRIELIDQQCKLILKRSVTDSGLSAYHLGSVYSPYPDCSLKNQKTAIAVMNLLHIESGSMDIIENEDGFYFIDINSVSNTSKDTIEMFSFDLMKETALYIVNKYQALRTGGI